MSNVPRRTAIAAVAALLAGHAVAACVVALWGWLIDSPDVSLDGLSILGLAQAGALALWVAFGPGPAFLRAPALPFGVGASCGLMALFQEVSAEDLKGEFGIILSLTVVQLVPLLVLRYFGLEIAAREAIEAGPSRARVQFSIRHLMALTLAIALLLTLWRFNPFDQRGGGGGFHGTAPQFASLFLLALVAAWTGCGRGPIVVRLLLLGMATFAAAFFPLAIEIQLGGQFFFYRFQDSQATALLSALVVAGTFLVVRSLGYRLTWRAPTAPAGDESWAERAGAQAASAPPGAAPPSGATPPARPSALLAQGDFRDAAIGLMVLAHGVVQLLLVSMAFGGWWGGGSLPLYREALLGIAIAQTALLGTWLVLGTRWPLVRAFAAALLLPGMIGVAGASSGAWRWARGRGPALADWEQSAAELCLVFGWSVLLCLLLRAAGARIEVARPDCDQKTPRLHPALRHLAAGAALVAAILLVWPALLAVLPLAVEDLVRPLSMTAALGIALGTGLSTAPFPARLTTLLAALSALAYPPTFLFSHLAGAFLPHTASVFLPGIAAALTFFTLSALGYRLVWSTATRRLQ